MKDSSWPIVLEKPAVFSKAYKYASEIEFWMSAEISG
jgi:hypothetical protein